MKGFKLNDTGDVSIINGHIPMVDGIELLRQTAQFVLNTNKGEWAFNVEEGINFYNILGKKSTRTLKTETPSRDIQRYYENEIAYMQTKDDELAERLQKRLDGVL